MYTKASKFSLVITDLVKAGMCQEAIDIYTPIVSADSKYTLDEGMKRATSGENNWTFRQICGKCDAEMRAILLNQINGAMSALRIYLHIADLTDAEDLLLEGKFTGKLPHAEKELEAGIVTRMKK